MDAVLVATYLHQERCRGWQKHAVSSVEDEPHLWKRDDGVKKHSTQIFRWKMNGRLLNQRTTWKYLSCRSLDTWKVFSENITLFCLPLCSFPVTSQGRVWCPRWLPQPLGVATVTSCSELRAWEDSLTVGKGQLHGPLCSSAEALSFLFAVIPIYCHP